MSVNAGPPAADPRGALDALDAVILHWVQDYYTTTDPVPWGLRERIDFAMDLLHADDEVALLLDDRFEAVGVRSANQNRTVTFDSESMTIVIQASPSGGAVRVDGWLAPPAVHRVLLRAGECELRTESDELGGFVLPQVPHGLTQLIVEVGDAGAPHVRTVATMAVVL